MSIVRRSNIFDPFSLDIYDPFEGFGFGSPFGALSRWDPFQGFNYPFGALSRPSSDTGEISAFANARIDWRETPDAHLIKVDIPGVNKEEVRVEVEEGRILRISGERRREVEDTTDTWHRVERRSGRFLRRFRLPENAKVDEVRAAIEGGVLTVTVPKLTVTKPEVKAIEIAG